MKSYIHLLTLSFSLSVFGQIPDYYNGLDLTQTGSVLKSTLSTKIIDTHTNELTYEDIWDASQITDVNPSNNNQVLLIYGYENGTDADVTNDRVAVINNYGTGSGKWNREHVYSNSLATPDLDNVSGNGAPYADAHNLRPCNNQRNSSRGNRKFSDDSGTASGATSESYTDESGDTQVGWYPGDEWKGDVARIAMYMYLRYGSQCLPTNLGLGDASNTFDDMIDLFLTWNVEDPVSDFELQRNTYHDSNNTYAQGNRNPFIDNPYFATKIWGGPQAEDKFGDVSDTETPTIPTNLVSSNVTGTSFSISWNSSTDNSFVSGYKIFLNDVEVNTSSSNSYNATGLSISSTYKINIKAYDINGNISASSSSILVHTGADNISASDLFISEYIEGSSNNKAIEIVNYTGSSIDLSSYSLKKQTNGSGSWSGTPISLNGTIVNGDVYVIANSSANSTILTQADINTSSQVVTFNGNDPIGLFKNDVLIDIIGVFDGGGTIFAENVTLQRKSSVTGPNSSYDTSEWLSLSSDTFSNIGAHLVSGKNTFIGTTDNDWDTSTNWSFNSIPNNIDVIIGASNNVNASGNISVNDLILEQNSSLTVGSNILIAGAVNLSSESSLIAKNSSSYNLSYTRYLTTNNWYLVSSPVVGETIEDVISNHTFATGSGSNIGLATYNTSNNSWTYLTASSTGTMPSGTGYAVKLASAGDISLSGTMKLDDTSIALTTSGNGYNLIGNPYPSYINSGSILSNSSSALENQTLWIWNQSSSSYDAKVTADVFKIAPGQGFFIKSDGSDGNVLIDEDDQSHQSSDTFQRTDPRPEIHIILSDGSNSKLAKIYYIEETTTGFDNGYDGPMFTGSNNSFAVYTHLVSDSEGIDYQIQSLPSDNYENMMISVGINAVSGTAINIGVSTINFPEGMNIYLEDKDDDSFTLLDGDTNFTTTLANDLNGIGRFYLHTTTGSLSADDLLMNNNISIYNSSRENLRIVGVQNRTAKVQLYNILGKEIFSNTFEGAGMNDIQLPSLAEGLYIVNLSTTNGKTNKKIIIQ